MSAHRDISASANLSPATRASKGLTASRWAPDAIDGQKTTTQQLVNVKVPADKAPKAMANSLANSRWADVIINDQKTTAQEVNNVKVPTDKASKPTTNGLVNFRWAANTAEPRPIRNRGRGAAKVQQKKYPNSVLNQPTRDPQDHELETLPSISNTSATTRCIIGPLSEEEKTVKMENPFFDPEKHKGLSSSRWAH